MVSDAKIKVLQFVAQMRPGGIEVWLMHVLRNLDRSRFQLDFLVHTDEPQTYDEEIRSLGGRIIPCTAPKKPIQYGRRLARILKEYGEFDVVHCHHQYFSGYIMWLAKRAGVPMRITHSHIDTLRKDKDSRWLRRCYLRTMRGAISRYATLGLSASGKAAAALFGPDWESDPRWRIHHCSVELTRFRETVDPQAVRDEIGIRKGARVVGHVGRMSRPKEHKNHEYWIAIAKELAARSPDFHFLLVGDGENEREVERWVREAGLSERLTLAGARNDVPRLLLGAMDVFLFPSCWEGLPVAMIEAQAAGLPCVYSDAITREVEIVPGLVDALSLRQPPSVWADRVMKALDNSARPTQEDSLRAVEESSFNIRQSVRELERFYCGQNGE